MKTKSEILKSIESVMHPAINFSLVKLGIVKDIAVEGETVKVIFALPFPNIPIINDLIFEVSQLILNMDLKFEYETVLMTEEEKARFMKLEQEGWKG
ncbi:MAG: iron-sulfur cluster assembly protein [Bacteroidota bacterium]|nr:iron-sulfur cluster assembly protein [Bacteroidota bacterium]